MPTFRNTLFHLHKQAGVKNELGLRNIGAFIREKVWLENSHFSKLVHSSHLPTYEDGTECSETSAYKIQTPGSYPEESIQNMNQFCHIPLFGGIPL
jgi:hypothetical protein